MEVLLNEADAAQLAAESYKDPHKLRSRDLLSQMSHIRFHENNNASAYTGLWNRLPVVVFRGTDHKKDVIRDVQFRRLRIRSEVHNVTTKQHRGFYQHLDEIWTGVVAHLQELAHSKGVQTVLSLGHSMGGAMAQQAAFRLINIGWIVHLATVASPRAGNKAFADYLNEHCQQIVRVRRYGDVVARAPFWFFGYRHTRGELYIAADGEIYTPLSWEMKLLEGFAAVRHVAASMADLLTLGKTGLTADIVGQHDKERYYKTLREWIEHRAIKTLPPKFVVDTHSRVR